MMAYAIQPRSKLIPCVLLPSLLVLFATVAAPLHAQANLLPSPREAHFGATTPVPPELAVNIPGHDSEDLFAAHDLEQAWKSAAHDGSSHTAYRVDLLRTDTNPAKALLATRKLAFDPAMEAEGYLLDVQPERATIVAASAAGIFYGVQTLKQLLPPTGSQPVLTTGIVRDWPAMRYRGIDDDLSRGPFPTLEFQEHQLRVFAAYKINLYSPYFEHTLVYPNQPLAAPPGGSLTPEEAAELVRYAARYHITIVPEQEAFGHLHHVLKYEIYSDVAETPHGSILAPGQPGSLPLIKDWFTQIAAVFPSPFLHIGADETRDLGRGLTHSQVEARGYGPVYVDFIKQIHETLAPLHRRLIFWGDIGGDGTDAVPGLPKDMIAVPWNYWDSSGFDKMLAPFAKAGIETWVSPGDANWNEVYPVSRTAFANIQGFIRDGQRMGSTGALTTVWNDDGEGLFNEDWYSLLFGAVAAWQPGESSITAYQDSFAQLFHGDTSGQINQAQKELIAAHDALDLAKTGMNSDELFWLDPWSAQGQVASAQLLPVAAEMRIHAEQAIVLVAKARQANPALREADALTAMDLGARRLDLIGLKFQLSQEIVTSFAQALKQQHDATRRAETHSMLEQISDFNGRCQDLRDAYSATRSEYVQVWQSENRPYWLNNVTVRFDLEIEGWQRRGDQFQETLRDWENGKELRAPSLAGLPEAANSAADSK
ncbi:MAG: glycoside hydrolase family 20 zincin-like fold domain-containing protein [Terracidiphilus sp.]|jgi:N-acetyl-beta-hexosaminidase